MHTSFLPRAAALAGLLLTGLGALPAPVSASPTTLTFDTLATEPGLTGDANPFSTANGGSSTVSGVTFNSKINVNADSTTNPVNWEVIGNSYKAPFSADTFGISHSGDYYLAGNTYKGSDSFGNTFSGLTISTTQALESLWVGADDNGFGSNDSDKVTITAYGLSGDLASQTAAITNPGLAFLDTSAKFGSLSGVTGYRFETNSLSLYATQGQGYLLADDMTFQTPVPEASSVVSMGLLLTLGLGGMAVRARRRKA